MVVKRSGRMEAEKKSGRLEVEPGSGKLVQRSDRLEVKQGSEGWRWNSGQGCWDRDLEVKVEKESRRLLK